MESLILTLTSVKGGTGKTTNTLNLAGIYSKLNKKVLIIDLDLYSGDIACILNLNNKKDIYNVFEDLTNNNFKDINDYITKYNDNIDVLCAPNDPRFANKISSTIINFIITKVAKRYDVILIDTNHFLNSLNLTAFEKSNKIIYVIKNDLMNLKSMKTFVSIYNNMNRFNYKILLYEATNKYKGPYSISDISNVIKHDIDYVIPNTFNLKNINQEITKGHILTLTTNNIKQYNDMAISLLKEVDHE